MSDSAGGFTPRVSRPASRTRMDRYYTARSRTWLKDEFLRFRALRPAVRDAEPVRGWYEALLRAMEVADRAGEEATGAPHVRTAAPDLTDVSFQIERLRAESLPEGIVSPRAVLWIEAEVPRHFAESAAYSTPEEHAPPPPRRRDSTGTANPSGRSRISPSRWT